MHKKERIGHKGDTLIDEDRLLAYIGGTMPPEEQHMLEEILEEDPFLNDAVDGLAEIQDKEQLRAIAAQINNHLRRQIKNRRRGRRRHRAKLTYHWGWIFVVVILLLALTAWWVIRMMTEHH